jgi:hypothetical protein
VLVGFAGELFTPDDAKIFSRTNKLFFTNVLGDCGRCVKAQERPYNFRLAEQFKITEEFLGRKDGVHGCSFLSKEFYYKLLKMLCDNPMLDGIFQKNLILSSCTLYFEHFRTLPMCWMLQIE